MGRKGGDNLEEVRKEIRREYGRRQVEQKPLEATGDGLGVDGDGLDVFRHLLETLRVVAALEAEDEIFRRPLVTGIVVDLKEIQTLRFPAPFQLVGAEENDEGNVFRRIRRLLTASSASASSSSTASSSAGRGEVLQGQVGKCGAEDGVSAVDVKGRSGETSDAAFAAGLLGRGAAFGQSGGGAGAVKPAAAIQAFQTLGKERG